MTTDFSHAVTEIKKNRQEITNKLIDYSLTDMLLFWSSNENLFKQQEKLWTPVLMWAKENLDAKFNTTQSLDIPEQKPDSTQKLKMFLDSLSDKELTAYYRAALNMRSPLLAAALVKGRINADQAFKASCLEELWQAEQWGKDEAAENRRKTLHKELQEIEDFLK